MNNSKKNLLGFAFIASAFIFSCSKKTDTTSNSSDNSQVAGYWLGSVQLQGNTVTQGLLLNSDGTLRLYVLASNPTYDTTKASSVNPGTFTYNSTLQTITVKSTFSTGDRWSGVAKLNTSASPNTLTFASDTIYDGGDFHYSYNDVYTKGGFEVL